MAIGDPNPYPISFHTLAFLLLCPQNFLSIRPPRSRVQGSRGVAWGWIDEISCCCLLGRFTVVTPQAQMFYVLNGVTKHNDLVRAGTSEINQIGMGTGKTPVSEPTLRTRNTRNITETYPRRT